MIVYYNITKAIAVDDNATDEQINQAVDKDSNDEATSWWKQIDEDYRVTFCDNDGNIMR